jgi:hypothetical protein
MSQISGQNITRRTFFQLSALGISAINVHQISKYFNIASENSSKLGRITVGKVDLKARPDIDSQIVGARYQDEIIPWLREVIGKNPFRSNQSWIETPDGYLWSPQIQPVRNLPSQPVDILPNSSLGSGMWVEVCVPFVDLILDNPPARAPWLLNKINSGSPVRWYYSQITWVDMIRKDTEGQTWYRLNERFGYGDILWGRAEAFRPLSQEEINPISPDIENKRILVDITRQTLSCFEDDREVYFARVSTGALYNINGARVESWGTPLGQHQIWRKSISLPLSGGSAAAGWDLPAVGWISLFVGSGVAIHSTFWHNNYGEPTSRGCVNASPDDSKWIFRWTMPYIPYDPGDITVSMPGGTMIEVIEI